MAVDSKHPDYLKALPQWEDMRAAYDGEYAVKEAGEKYLPMPSGFKHHDDGGAAAYDAYKLRAQFPKIVSPTVRGMNGVIHRVESQIELPAALEGMFEKATPDGLPLEALHRRITREILMTGRYGLLADIGSDEEANRNPDTLPHIATYRAEAIINWSEKRDLYVLDECGLVLGMDGGFEWRDHKQYRALRLVDGAYQVQVFNAESQSGNPDGLPEKDVKPQVLGGKPLTEIPFVVIGSSDLKPEIDEIPLQGVAQSAFAMYRLDADYRWQLFMSGQETLVLTGVQAEDKPKAVGAGVVLTLKEGADAKYVGPSGSGITAHRTAIEDEKNNAVLAGARLFENVQKSAESGDALRIRFAAQTATLTSIAQAAAQGLEKALKFCAMIVGANPDEVVVKPNLSFIDTTLTPQDALALVQAWQLGGFSKLTLYENLQRGEIASQERTFDEEQALLEDEMPDVGDGTGLVPGQPVRPGQPSPEDGDDEFAAATQ